MSVGAWRWVGTRTAPESPRALGESFLSFAVEDLASLSLLGDAWSGACGDWHLKGLKARGCHSSGLVCLQSPSLNCLEHRGSHSCAPPPARMLAAARESSVHGKHGPQTCPAWSRGPALPEELSLSSLLWLCSLLAGGTHTCQGTSTMGPLAACRKPARSIQMTALELWGGWLCWGEGSIDQNQQVRADGALWAPDSRILSALLASTYVPKQEHRFTV